jgi:hypothetical protein
MRANALLTTVCLVVIGLAIGAVCARLPIRPVLQSLVAGLASWVLGSIVGVVLRLLEPVRRAGIGAVSFGIAEWAMGCAFALGTALAIHLGMGVLGSAIHPGLASWRLLLIGVGGTLAGVSAYSSGDVVEGPTE